MDALASIPLHPNPPSSTRMAASHPVPFLDVLEAIPHVPEKPHPHGALAAQRWTRLIVELVLKPSHWHKLGFAVQWAKWVEWESGHDLKGSTRSPGILYLQNPLHPFALNNLLNCVDFGLIDIETLCGCIDTGDWTCLLKEEAAAGESMLRDQVTQSLENLCLFSFYLRWSLVRPTGADRQEVKEHSLIEGLVSRLLKDANGPSGRNAVWYQAFKEQSLRLTPQQDPSNPTLPSKLSVLLNELLETVRLERIRHDGWNDPSVSDKLTDAQFQQLGKMLSTSFFTIMEFADVSLYLPVENVVFLSKFAAQLPASWYSDDFLRTTIRMAKRFILTEKQDKIRVPSQLQGLVAMTTLWSFWMRKTGAQDANVLGQELVELMADILSTPSCFTGSESRGLLGACFSGLATGLDKWAGLTEPQIVDGLVAGLERGRLSAQDSDMDGIQASLATVLRADSSLLNPASVKKLTVAFLGVFYGDSSMTQFVTMDELFQIQRLFQFVVTQKAGLAAVKDQDESKKKRKNRKPKKAVNLKALPWWQELVQGLTEVSAKESLPSLLAIAGTLRAIQHAEDDPPRVDAESLALVEDLFVSQLGFFIQALDTGTMLSSQVQACLVFATCQTIPNLPACKLTSEQRSVLATLLIEYMLSPNDGTIPINEILRVISFELARSKDRVPLHSEAHQLLTKTVKGPLFSEMGRVARTVANLMEGMHDWGQIETLLQKMHAFAINAHVDWSRCGLSREDSFIPRMAEDPGLDPETTKSMAMLLQVFKTLLFAYTMIFGTAVEKSSKDPVTAAVIAQIDFIVLDSYAYLFFITYKLGPGGFQVYEELITTILGRMVAADEPNRAATHAVLNKTLKAMMPRAEWGYREAVMESRTLFYLNLLERVMVAIDEEFLEEKLLPLVYPYLLANDQKDLFESAHSVVMSVFLTRKQIAKNVAPYYSNLLLAHFPKEINIDQLRAAFTTMIRSLSETEDALAWLCVEKLLERIQQYDDDFELHQQQLAEEQALVQVATSLAQDLSPQDSSSHLPSLGTITPPPAAASPAKSVAMLERQKERGQLLLALFDQLSSLNLVFVETLGEEVRRLLMKEQSPVSRKALLKCLLDVIGGPAVDHTKRDWAVKWYLGLVSEFGGDKGSTLSSSSPASTSLPSSLA